MDVSCAMKQHTSRHNCFTDFDKRLTFPPKLQMFELPICQHNLKKPCSANLACQRVWKRTVCWKQNTSFQHRSHLGQTLSGFRKQIAATTLRVVVLQQSDCLCCVVYPQLRLSPYIDLLHSFVTLIRTYLHISTAPPPVAVEVGWVHAWANICHHDNHGLISVETHTTTLHLVAVVVAEVSWTATNLIADPVQICRWFVKTL